MSKGGLNFPKLRFVLFHPLQILRHRNTWGYELGRLSSRSDLILWIVAARLSILLSHQYGTSTNVMLCLNVSHFHVVIVLVYIPSFSLRLYSVAAQIVWSRKTLDSNVVLLGILQQVWDPQCICPIPFSGPKSGITADVWSLLPPLKRWWKWHVT